MFQVFQYKSEEVTWKPPTPRKRPLTPDIAEFPQLWHSTGDWLPRETQVAILGNLVAGFRV